MCEHVNTYVHVKLKISIMNQNDDYTKSAIEESKTTT